MDDEHGSHTNVHSQKTEEQMRPGQERQTRWASTKARAMRPTKD